MKSSRVRLIVDVLAVTVAVHTMMAVTPVGGLVRRAVNAIFERDFETRPLVSYFRTATGDVNTGTLKTALAFSEAPTPGSQEYREAKRAGIDPKLAKAIVVMASGGKLDEDGLADIRFPKQARRAFESVGVKIPAKDATPKARRAAFLEGIKKLASQLDSVEGAVAACVTDVVQVQYALDKAKAAGREDATSIEGFSPFLPPDARKKAKQFTNGVFALETAFAMKNPVRAPHRVSSKFGYRHHPVLKRRKLHTGVDVAIPTGTKLHAVAAGKVVYATEDSVNGKFVKIDHGHGLTSAYCHASRLDVKRGEKVKQDDVIALSGMTGRATGPHLHFQVEIDDEPVDPQLFIRNMGKQQVGLRDAADRVMHAKLRAP